MKQISYEHVIAVIEADEFQDIQSAFQGFIIEKHMWILTEYCAGGNLNERLTRPSSEEMNIQWLRQIAAGIAYLHSCRVVHRDLKPENVLLTENESIKLADFGLAREYIALKQTKAQRCDGSWMTTYIKYYMQSYCDTPDWMAPEVFSDQYTEKADVFSLGVLFFAILEREFVLDKGERYYATFDMQHFQMLQWQHLIKASALHFQVKHKVLKLCKR